MSFALCSVHPYSRHFSKSNIVTMAVVILLQIITITCVLVGHFISGLIANHPIHRHQYRRTDNIERVSVLYTTPKDDEEDKISGNDESIDLNQQKLELENMINNIGGTDATANKNTAILTSSRKQRLLREIELIKQLDPEHPENNIEYSDIQNQELVVSQLWAIWYGERGPINEMKLREVEDEDPNQWPEAENKYLELIRVHCSADGSMDNLNLSNWVEPANRLATLLFLMGRFSESKEWCDKILDSKPWHIGALSGTLKDVVVVVVVVNLVVFCYAHLVHLHALLYLSLFVTHIYCLANVNKTSYTTIYKIYHGMKVL